jgi:hypothetical protein
VAGLLASDQVLDLIPHLLHGGARADELCQLVHSVASLLRGR